MLRFPRNFVCQWAQPTLNKVLQGVRRSFIHDTAHSQKDRSLGNVLILEERSLLSGTPFPIESQVDFEVVSFTDPEITTTPKPDQSTLAVLEDPFQQELVSHKPIQEKPGQNSSFSSYTTSKIKTPSPTNLHQTGRQEVVVIDPATQNHKQLVNDLLQNQDPNLNLDVVILDANENGIDQISDLLAGYNDLEALHIVSHGSLGKVKLGNEILDLNNLSTYGNDLRDWREAFSTEGDILFYGCNFAGSDAGQELLNELSVLTGTDVSASVDNTGHSQLGGNWDLEFSTGSIETNIAFSSEVQKDYQELLDIVIVTTTNDILDGDADTSSLANLLANPGSDGEISLREAIIAANADPGADEILLQSGTYILSSSGAGDEGGDLDIKEGLTITGLGTSTTIIDGNLTDKVFEVHSNSGSVTISDVTIQNGNSGSDGGGIEVNTNNNLILQDVWLKDNSASNGGGLFLQTTASATLERVTISGNSSSNDGAGISAKSIGNLTLTNVTISGNVAGSNGGGIYTERAIFTTNVTIAFNSAATAGGIDVVTGGSVTLQNTILFANTGNNTNQALISNGYNIDSDGTANLSGPGDQSGTIPSPIDVKLGVLQDNGGQTPTHALRVGSPAVDGGTETGAPGTDQRGMPREGHSDIGGFEWLPPPAMLFSTAGQATPNANLGLENWEAGELIGFGNPNFEVEPGGTTGTFTPQFNLSNFAQDGVANINGTHYVSVPSIVVNGITLFQGDILFSTVGFETLIGSDSVSLSPNPDDVILFRPLTPENYSEGTFSTVIEGLGSHGEENLQAFTLVEKPTVIGNGVSLSPGDLLIAANQDYENLYHFHTPTLGRTLLLAGPKIGINKAVTGLDLIEEEVTLGGTTLSSGNLLVSVDDDFQAGNNNLPVTKQDVFILDVTETELFGGTTTATATTLFDGSKVGLEAGNGSEAINGLSLVNTNLPPSIAWTNEVNSLPEDTDTSSSLRVADIVLTDDGIGNNLLTLSGPDASLFEVVGSQVFLKSGTTLDHETNPALEVTLEVDDPNISGFPDDLVSLTINVTDVNEPPTVSLQNAISTLGENTDTSSSIKISDIIVTDDALGINTLALTGTDAALFEIIGFELFLRAGSILDFETNPILDVSVQVDDPLVGSTPDDTAPLSLIITDSNDPPTVSLINTTTVLAEDTDTSSAVKVADIIVTDDALGSESLSVGGADAALFEIVGTELFLRVGTALDFETNPVLDVSVEVDDPSVGSNPDDTVPLSISVSNINEPPGVSLTNTITILAEDSNTSSALKVADIVVTDDALGTNILSLTGADAPLFEIAGAELFLKAGTFLDFESNPFLDVNVQVEDPFVGSTPDDIAPLSITITDANDPPTVFLTNTITSLAEDADTSSAIKVADIVVNDDALGSNTLALAGTDSTLFEIIGTELFLRAGTSLDFETNPILDISVQVDDALVGSTPDDTSLLSISIINVNDPPTVVLTNTTTLLSEDTDTSSVIKVADISIVDDVLGINILSLTGSDNTLFAITGNELFLKAGTTLDFETNPVLDVTLQVDDPLVGTTPDDTALLSITIGDVNEPPSISLSNITSTLPEDTDTVGSIKVADIVINDDALGTNTLSLAGTDSALFEIVGMELFLKAGTTLDHEGNSTLNVIVQVDDSLVGSTPDDTASLALSIINVNETPIIGNQSFSIAENSASGTSAGSVSASDPDFGDSLTFSITSGNTGNAFSINSNTGEIFVDNSSALDFETTPTFTLTVQVQDIGSLMNSATVTIDLNDVNEAPVANNDNYLTGINQTLNVPAMGVLANDPDPESSTLNAILVSGPGNASAFNLNSDGSFSYTPTLGFQGVDSFTYRANDGSGDSNVATVSITVDSAPGGVFTNITLWLRADTGVTQSGTVSHWNNLITNPSLPFVSQPSSSQQPAYNPNGANFNPVLLFDGIDDSLVDNSVLGSDLFSSDSVSIFTVANVTGNGVVIQWLDDLTNRVSVENSSSSSRFDFGDFTNDSITGNPAGSGYHVFNLQAAPGAVADLSIWVDGYLDVQGPATSANPLDHSQVGQFALGQYPSGGFNAGMEMSEVIIYSTELSPLEQQKIDSYLALKYGITLDQTNPTDYLASDGTVIWDSAAHIGFNSDLAGIGRDDLSGLNQQQSRSINSDSVVTVSSASSQDDGEFLVWGNNDGLLDETTSGTPSSITQRLERIWHAHKVGDLGTTTIEFDLSSLSVSGSSVSDFYLLIDSDIDFTSGSTQIAATTFNGNTVTFTGVNLGDDDYFTLGTKVNSPPTITNQSFSLDENSSDGTSVGTVLAADPDTGDSLTFTIESGNTAGAFTINTTSGEISVANSAALDFETTPVFNLTIQVQDTGGLTDDAIVTINLNDLSEGPTDLKETQTQFGGLSINEAGGNNNYLFADDGGSLLGGLGQFTFEIRFQSTSSLGNAPLLSYTNSSGTDEIEFSFQFGGDLQMELSPGNIVTTSGFNFLDLNDGFERTISFTWENVTGRWEVFVDGASVDSGAGFAVGHTIAFGGTLVFGQAQEGVDSGYNSSSILSATLFDIRFFNDVRTPVEILTNHDQTLLYNESGMIANWTFDQLSVNGITTDTVNANNLTLQEVPIGSGFVANAPSLTFQVDENSNNGIVIGTIVGSELQRESKIAELLSADPNLAYSPITNKFYKQITSTTSWPSALSAATSSTLNGVNGQLVTIRSAAEQEIIFNIGASTGQTIWLGASDQNNEGDWYWYNGPAEDDQFWQGNGSGLIVNDAYENWDKVPPEPNDVGGEDFGRMYTSGPRTGLWDDGNSASHAYIIEWNGDEVLDQTDPLVYSLVDDAGGRFSIDGDDGKITVADGSLLDFEVSISHDIIVRVTDGSGRTYDEVFAITIKDVNEPPVVPNHTFNIDENSTDGTVVGTVSTSPPDTGDSHTFSITGGNIGNTFTINSTTGEITVLDNSILDFETTPTFNLTVQVDDTGGFSDSAMVTIQINNVNEDPTADPGGPYNISEGEFLNLDGSGSLDPDNDLLSYSWDLDNDGIFGDATGPNPVVDWATLTSFGIDDDGTFTIGLQVDDGNLGIDTELVQLLVNDTPPMIVLDGPATIQAGAIYTLDLLVTDPGNDLITSWTINWGDGTIETIAGNPPSVNHVYSNSGLKHDILAAVTDDEGNTFFNSELFVTSQSANQIFRFDGTTGNFLQNFGSVGEGLSQPIGVLFGLDGNLYVVSSQSNSVLRYDVGTGTFIDEFITTGPNRPFNILYGRDGNFLVAEFLTNSVSRYDASTGAGLGNFVVPSSGGLNGPAKVSFGPDGNLYVTSFLSHEILRYDGITGNFIDVFVAAGSGGLQNPSAATWGPDGNLYVTSYSPSRILKYDGTDGTFLGEFVGSAGGLVLPGDIIFGPDGNVYVSDLFLDVVKRFAGVTGTFIDDYISASAGGLIGPGNISFKPDHQIQILPANPPIISGTVAGQLITDKSTINPFAGVTITDFDIPPQTLTVTIALDDPAKGVLTNLGGFVEGPSGTYMFTGSASSATSEIRNLIFDPTENRVFPGLTETTSFTITIDDGIELPVTDTTTSVITTSINDSPQSNSQSFSLDENSSSGTSVGVVTASDPDTGDSLTYSIIGGNTGNAFSIDTATGEIKVDNSSVIDFETMPVFNIIVQVEDLGNLADTAAVQITLNDRNDSPEIADQTFSLNENSSAGTSVGSVVASDPDLLDSIDYSIIGGNTNGAFVIDMTSGEITVANSSPLDFETTPVFNLSVQVSDLGGLTDTGIIQINLNNGNDTPTLNNQTFNVDENSSNTSSVGTVGAFDPDVSDILTYSILGGNTGGAFAINSGTGQLTVGNSSALNFEAIPIFDLQVQVQDLGGLSDTATIRILVNNVNEQPAANNENYITNEDSPLNVKLDAGILVNDIDPESDPLTAVLVNGPVNGTLILNPDGSFRYIPNLNFFGKDGFSYVADDGSKTSGKVFVPIIVSPVDDLPVAFDDKFTVEAGSSLTGMVLQNDIEWDGEPITASLLKAPENGTLVFNKDGSFTFVSEGGFSGSVTFSYTASDSISQSNPATVTINVIGETILPEDDSPFVRLQPSADHPNPSPSTQNQPFENSQQVNWTPLVLRESNTGGATQNSTDRSLAPVSQGNAGKSSDILSASAGNSRIHDAVESAWILSSTNSLHVDAFLPENYLEDFLNIRSEDLQGSTFSRNNRYLLPMDLFQNPDGAGSKTNLVDNLTSTGIMATTGLLATAGYMLLNTRAFAWLLTLAASQAAWKEYDPLQVIYAWEKEQHQDGDQQESLLSLVE